MSRSRIVAWLRVILPLAALALLSVLFLLGRRAGEEGGIPYSRLDDPGIAQRQVVTNPTYTGLTRNGSELTITGVEAEPGARPGDARMTTVHMILRARDGRAADVTAGTATLVGDQARLSDGVRMTTADGWIVTAPEFLASISAGTLVAEREVDALAPFGTLTAGRMELRPRAPGDPDHLLDFGGGVRLIYQP